MSDTTSPSATQSYGNHARWVPGYHFFTGTVTLLALFWALYRVATIRTLDSAFPLLIAIALMGQFWYLRQFPLRVQDRLIRLEERLRLMTVLPPELRTRVDELTGEQLIALRFASDAELPALTRQVLDARIGGRAAIKKLVRNWRPDTMRA